MFIGTEACQEHLRSEHRLDIRYSNIPGAGLGLFCHSPESGDRPVFSKGETILEYTGETLDAKQVEERYGNGTGPYVLKLSEDMHIDAALRRCAASIANGSKGIFTNNAVFVGSRIEATRSIMHGDEIILSYGVGYWSKGKGGRGGRGGRRGRGGRTRKRRREAETDGGHSRSGRKIRLMQRSDSL